MLYLQIPASLSFRYLAVRAVAAICRALGQPLDLADAVMSAVGEAFNNAVLHGVPEQPALDTVEIEVGVRDEALLIRVIDYGHGFLTWKAICTASTTCPKAAWACTSSAS